MSDENIVQIKIRQYTPMDEEKVHKINQDSLEISFRYFYSTFHRREPELFLVAEYNSKLVGFILVRNGENFGEYPTALIFAIAVAPKYRSLSIGTQLVNAIIDVLKRKQIKKLFLHVRVGNKLGVQFYERLGFTIIKEIEEFYSWGEAAYRMAKNLE